VPDVHPGILQGAIAEHHRRLGIALDGDGTAVLMADGVWNSLYDGDELLFVIARERAKKTAG